MVARVTLAEIDTVRTSIRRAVELFEQSVVPELRELPGYEGCTVLTTPEGKALVATYWDDAASAEGAVTTGTYSAQVEKFITFMGAPPGRQSYDVSLVDEP